MKTNKVEIIKYEAEEGKCFDWKDLTKHTHTDKDGNLIQDHLYANVLWIGQYDSIENYVEVEVVEDEHTEN